MTIPQDAHSQSIESIPMNTSEILILSQFGGLEKKGPIFWGSIAELHMLCTIPSHQGQLYLTLAQQSLREGKMFLL